MSLNLGHILDELEDEVNSHIEYEAVADVECSECGKNVGYDISFDDDDKTVTVIAAPCECTVQKKDTKLEVIINLIKEYCNASNTEQR